MNVAVKKNGAFTTVAVNRPRQRNAVDEKTAGELL